MLSVKVGFLGAGQMATALAKGLVEAELVRPDALLASDPAADARQRFSAAVPAATVSDDNRKIAAQSDVVLLAVKPQQIDAVLSDVRDAVGHQTVVISIAAGVTLSKLTGALPPETRLVRVMPNTPCLIRRGVSAYSLGAATTPQDGHLVEQLLAAVGPAYQVPEKLLDAVTGLSGSGPAFVYTVIEALSDGGVLVGLPRELASALAVQTVAGAAEMVATTGEHPAQLRDRVASPAGTTMAGLKVLEQGGLRSALIEAVHAATLRSRELSEE